MQNQ
jgi:hypothetical protein